MMKRFTFLMLSLCIALMPFAQNTTVKVQGVPRTVAKSQAAKVKASSSDSCGVDFSKIKRWVGTGSNKAAMIVVWNDSLDNNSPLIWGYRWESGTKTGEDMLLDIAQADPSFYLLVYSDTQYGAAIGGFGYDLNGDGNIGLLNKGTECTIANGVCSTTDYDFDNYSPRDVTDHWKSGWYNGYWSYYTGKEGGKWGYSGVGASGRKLTNGSIDKWDFMSFTGETAPDPGDKKYLSALSYKDGMFVINEDWYGHQNSTLNYLSAEGEWTYRVIQKENPGVELGCTSQYATIYGNKMYIMSKQEKDPGASITGGRLTVVDVNTMKVLKQIQNIATNASGKSAADGRAFLGVDENKAYIGSSNGIYVYDINAMEIGKMIPGTENTDDSAYGSLYYNQIGNMVRVNDKVYATHQSAGLFVIDANADTIIKTIKAPDSPTWSFGSVVLSKDGNLWLSLSAPDGMGTADTRIVKVDPKTDESTVITLPKGIYGPANSWYAWTPDGFCASKQSNVLYWNGGENSWFSSEKIFKYDIDTNTASLFIDYSKNTDGWKLYGCSMRVDPVTDYLCVSLYKDFGTTSYTFRKYDTTGAQVSDHPMISNYWFPSVPVFLDNATPTVLNNPSTTTGEATTVDLSGVAVDDDNMDAAIVKTVYSNSNSKVLTATMENGDLAITPIKDGSSTVTVKINSNGKIAYCKVTVKVSGFVGVEGLNAEDATEVARYNIDGRLLNAPERGINIIRMSDGTVKKVLVK